MWTGETVDPTIRNLRYDRWRPIMVWLLVAAGWAAVFVLLATSSMQPFKQAAYAVLALIAFFVSVAVVAFIPWMNQVARVKLGDDMEVNPGWWHYPPARILQIALSPDPTEDYHDYAVLPVRTCEVRIKHRRRGTFRLIVSETDAERLRQWSNAKGIKVCESDGYRPRTAEPAAEA